jgi:hypothetical protein
MLINILKNFINKKTTMEEHKITKRDKLIYAITLGAIFFGILIIGLIGVIVNIFG